VIEDQKIVVGRTTTVKRARKSQAKKPASKSSFIQHQNNDYSNDLRKFEKGKRGSEMFFPLFPFSNLFYLFSIFFYFIKYKGAQKQICSGKGEKKMVDLGVREKIQMQMVEEGWKGKWDNYGLPPSKSFTFIVCEQDCVRTFED
jgi:hypothetical protein